MVDNFFVASQSRAAYQYVLADLRLEYEAKDLGIVRRLLGWLVRPIAAGEIHLSQPCLTYRFMDVPDINRREKHPRCACMDYA